MKLTILAAAAALGAVGVIAQHGKPDPNISGHVVPSEGLHVYTVWLKSPDSVCLAVADGFNRVKGIQYYTCAGYLDHDHTQIHITAVESANEEIIQALDAVFPGIFAPYGFCRAPASTVASNETNTSIAQRGIAKRTDQGQAVFDTCDITSAAGQNNGKATLLFNVDIGLPFNGGSGCEDIRKGINSVGDYTCQDNGNGGTSLKFTTERSGTVLGVRDDAARDVLNAYGSVVTSYMTNDVAGHGSCTLTYPSKHKRRANSDEYQLAKRVDRDQADIIACELTSEEDLNAGKTDLLFQMEIGKHYPDDPDLGDDLCDSIKSFIHDLTSWTCQRTDVGYVLLKFTTKREGSLVPVRDGVVEDLANKWPDLDMVVGGIRSTGFCDIQYDGINRQLSKRAPAPGHADFNICDITSDEDRAAGQIELLVNVDMGSQVTWCAYQLPHVDDIKSWNCDGNGSGGMDLRFTVNNQGSIVEVRDRAVADVLNKYGNAITSHTEGGVHSVEFCTALYPPKGQGFARLTERDTADGHTEIRYCDMTFPGESLITLLINVEARIPYKSGQACNYLKQSLGAYGDWYCEAGGVDDPNITELRYLIKYDGTIVQAQRAARSDLRSVWGDDMTTYGESAMYGRGKCKLLWPN